MLEPPAVDYDITTTNNHNNDDMDGNFDMYMDSSDFDNPLAASDYVASGGDISSSAGAAAAAAAAAAASASPSSSSPYADITSYERVINMPSEYFVVADRMSHITGLASRALTGIPRAPTLPRDFGLNDDDDDDEPEFVQVRQIEIYSFLCGFFFFYKTLFLHFVHSLSLFFLSFLTTTHTATGSDCESAVAMARVAKGSSSRLWRSWQLAER